MLPPLLLFRLRWKRSQKLSFLDIMLATAAVLGFVALIAATWAVGASSL
jgi:hypothetical protein